MTDEELIKRITDVAYDHGHDILYLAAERIEQLQSKLAKAVEDAFCEGFAEGYDGTWVEGDYTPAWKKSHALANLEKAK
jgi:hypothetical protein